MLNSSIDTPTSALNTRQTMWDLVPKMQNVVAMILKPMVSPNSCKLSGQFDVATFRLEDRRSISTIAESL